jgi:chromosome segregation ATPase
MTKKDEKKTSKPRKTLMQLQGEVGVTDPSQHARRQVSELDKTAQRSLAKKKFTMDQMASDTKELKHLDKEINELRKGYDPLCRDLAEKEKKRKELIKQLESCKNHNINILKEIKGTVVGSRLQDMKLFSKMAKQNLEVQRGYTLGPSSTFKQSGTLSLTKMGMSSTRGSTGGRGNSKSAATLPPLGHSSDSKGLKRNESSIL